MAWASNPRSGFIHIDSGPVRNWTLEERGLEHLLLRLDQLLASNGSRLKLTGDAQTLGSSEVRLDHLAPAPASSPSNAQQQKGLKRLLDEAIAHPFTQHPFSQLSPGKN